MKFVSGPKHSIERERLLYLTAVQELKLFAAIHGEQLMVTEPELDIEGFDFTITTQFESVYLQSKGTLNPGGQRQWQIRAALIKPSFYNRDVMPYLDGSPVGGYTIGATGGVVIHMIEKEAAARDLLEVSYYYLDIFWLIAVASGAAGLGRKKKNRALDLLRKIRSADDNERVTLRLTDFAKLKSFASIAALRLHVGGPSNWISASNKRGELSDEANQVSAVWTLMWPGVDALA